MASRKRGVVGSPRTTTRAIEERTQMPISGELIAGALAGLAFVGCSLGGAAPTPGQGRRREVVVNGKRVKTVDVHAHCIVPEAAALINPPLTAPGRLWHHLTAGTQR